MRRNLVLVFAFLVAACGSGTAVTSPPTNAPTIAPGSPAPTATAIPTTALVPTTGPSSTPETVPSASPPLAPENLAVSIGPSGNFVGYGGLTLYTFDDDEPGASNCSGDCLFNWPPLLVAAADDIPLGEGLDAADFATITREDGALQVTYNGMPLYFYLEDVSPGDTKGEGLGGVWHLITIDAVETSGGGAVDY
jgi:predicted lipoprotein with Yx(FWY)xxD motif